MEDTKKPESLGYRAPTTEKLGSESYKSHHFEQPADTSPATMGFNSAVIKPETRANKAEHAGQYLEQPKCKICNDRKEIVRTFTGSIGLETAWRPKGSSTSREDETRACPNCTCTEQPNLKIIEEIEGLISQVNEKLDKLDVIPAKQQDLMYYLKSQALEEIDLFQKTTLFKLRKAFE